MPAYLRYKSETQEEKVPCKAVLTIGRDRNSDIVINDLMVSRNHAVVRQVGRSDYYLIDSGSSNGSFINKKRIAMPTLLKNGDQVTIGKVSFVFNQSIKEKPESDTLSMQKTIVTNGTTIKTNTILVADIREFTRLSEEVDIKVLTQLMNNWFAQVADTIVVHGGEVDKFIGDCVFARWDTGDDEEQTVLHAIKAAHEINSITDRVSAEFRETKGKMSIGVGINTGSASVGVGQENTAMGDAVNVAFRLESATKQLGNDVVLSASCYQYIPDKFWEGNEKAIRLKGKKEAVKIIGLDFPQLKKIIGRMEKERGKKSNQA